MNTFNATEARQLQIVWLALVLGVTLFAGVAVFLRTTGAMGDADPEMGRLLFLISAAVSIGSVVVAFALQRRLEAQLAGRSTTEAMTAIRTTGIASMAVMEGGALLGIVAALVGGNLLALAFTLPFYGFAALFFPSEARLAHLHGLTRDAS